MPSRRRFLTGAGAVAALPVSVPAKSIAASGVPATVHLPLDGTWEFRPERSGADWTPVSVPHTWQVMPGLEDHYGVAWYRREFEVPASLEGKIVRIEFESVFHSATVWINDRPVGDHHGKGYTAFTLDVTAALAPDGKNRILVKVDNSFNDGILPRGRSSDWAHDGGIYRPVSLLISPRVFVERVAIDAVPDLASGSAALEITASVRSDRVDPFEAQLSFRVIEDATGATVLRSPVHALQLSAGETSITLPAIQLPKAKLWHFDHPNLYRAELTLTAGATPMHGHAETFGIRSFEARADGLFLNGERVFLMGTERMAGSNPEFGMAEPARWIEHDHDDLKELNCVFTRVHWQQDRRVLDYCDRHGILVQVEVPAWGPKTFEDMKEEPSAAILENGLHQLREMIQRDRNHPSVFAWGLCNEIGGQNPPAFQFAKRMYEEARKLDPRRLRSYASHSLFKTPDRDVAGLMDIIEWNEYYGSWQAGNAEDLRKGLEQIHKAFPSKPIVISEYGYCACTADRPEGDQNRIEVLRDHDSVFRGMRSVAGMIFFCYNDYRTHIGDKGTGSLKQRVHGVVDVYGARKPSFEVLRRESSPVDAINIEPRDGVIRVTVRTRESAPAYTLEGYKLRCLVIGPASIPYERLEQPLPRLRPGESASLTFRPGSGTPLRLQFDLLRPTGFSAWTEVWNG